MENFFAESLGFKFKIPQFWIVLLWVLFWGCQDKGLESSSQKGQEQPQAPADQWWIKAWQCNTLQTCFGYEEGLTRHFIRKRGKLLQRETWMLLKIQSKVQGGQEVQVLEQKGGPSTYEVDAQGLYMSVRGHWIKVLAFPVQTGRSVRKEPFKDGSHLEIRVDMEKNPISISGRMLSPCLNHEMQFFNAQGQGDLLIKTVYCKGLGEVKQTIQLSGIPRPVEIERQWNNNTNDTDL